MGDKNEDTNMAKEYIEENEANLKKIENHELTITYEEMFLKKIDCLQEKLSSLANKVEQNCELFAQLWHLERGTSKEEVKSYDIPLIVQYLRDSSSNVVNYVASGSLIILNDSTRITMFGYITTDLMTNSVSKILFDDKYLPICFLFGQLCREAGLNVSYTRNMDSVQASIKSRYDKFKDLYTMGVVTERSDIDSAVDSFLSSPAMGHYPWNLGRVLVQESVYERFKKALAWKCKLRIGTALRDQKIGDLCTEVLDYDEKIFLIDFAGTLDQLSKAQPVILVQAFRTVKELLLLAKEYAPFCISLWSSGISEANEIAFSVEAAFVWMNAYGVVNGSPMASQAYYSNISDICNDKPLSKVGNNWSKLNVKDRVDKVIKALNKCELEISDSKDIVTKMRSVISRNVRDKYVEIDGGKMWIGISLAKERYIIKPDRLLEKLLLSIIRGNTIKYSLELSENVRNIMSVLERENLPITNIRNDHHSNVFISHIDSIKVVYTTFETIFAN